MEWRAGALVAAGVLATGCSATPAHGDGGGDVISASKIETSIEHSYLKTREIEVNADCPSGVKIEPTREFQCIVRYRMLKIIVNVTIQNDAGDVVWRTVDGSLSG